MHSDKHGMFFSSNATNYGVRLTYSLCGSFALSFLQHRRIDVAHNHRSHRREIDPSGCITACCVQWLTCAIIG